LITVPGSKRRKRKRAREVRAKKVASVMESLRKASLSPVSTSFAKSSSCAPGERKA